MGKFFTPSEEYILNGGLILQVLSADEMTLRKFYFKESGLPVPDLYPAAKDLLQVCKDTNEILISRNNIIYRYGILTPENFRSAWDEMMDEVFAQTQPPPKKEE